MNLTAEEYGTLTAALDRSLTTSALSNSIRKKLERAYRHPQPFITADVIIWRTTDRELQPNESYMELLLSKRGREPYLDHWALPGGHFDTETDESIRDAAFRELEEETGITRNDIMLFDLPWFGYYDQKKRDTRGRYVNFVYSGCCTGKVQVKAADDAKDHQWMNANRILDMPLAFDYKKILGDFIFTMRQKSIDE